MRFIAAIATSAALGLAITTAAATPAWAGHDMTCHPPDEPTGPGGPIDALGFKVIVEFPGSHPDFGWVPVHAIQVDDQGDATARGPVLLRQEDREGGRSPVTALQPTSAQVACADLDDDGIAGIAAIEVGLEGGFVLTILASEPDIDSRDPVVVTAELRGDDTTRTAEVTARVVGPDRRGR